MSVQQRYGRQLIGAFVLGTAIVWLASGGIVLWLQGIPAAWVIWIVAGIILVIIVRAASLRWVKHSFVTPLEELKAALDALAIGQQVVSHRYSTRPFDELARAVERVAERIQAVEQSVEHLQKVRSQFLANVSHELRTPLFALEGYLETLLDGALEDPAVARNFLEKAQTNLQRLSTLLADLVEIARIESGEMRMSFRYFDIADLARTIAQQYEQRAHQQDVSISVVAPPEQLAYGDRERIGQVLANLVSNAIKYNVPGGSVVIRIVREDGRVAVSVEDTGIGIPPEHHARVFERFYRVDAARSRAVGGSGLGLAIVKHILEAHRAPFELQSEVGKGTTIRFWLKS
ncbi:MAG: ATP-binding protein [Bacteroidota bacterium]|nr:ATP-binding protein [Candidatus Kapabacteria bacterium]MDW8272234.1 ATP-binding protein [Bacteroidota bacterium]